ncbi:MAG: ABC transporter ATP-binding protein [Gemmatimonadaceae bacterium]|nr:ABC transporter ATP-binding protein [Gemmatimonadaceae bacterium]NUQ91445.1 ABC transporter ATP-binding protein [Gemmatimonadaceae bacterium]NUR20283.1 ABC transporter ATP-binding protein [Gemmatimonadaceae bacterium]NUS95972.1 ABC transporter ATP-binding protein [Gemmatimonadaceae bacterium]
MTDYAIEGLHLSKRYRIGVVRERYSTMRDRIGRAGRTAISALRRRDRLAAAGPRADEFWALDDVSFQVRPGEVVGVIGRNGAGKSTLLKLLSRIAEPTSGEAFVTGRVGSLLEVGTGFHLELTGRENVYLNGAILGMKRAEIARKFDEIVDFAEVRKFVDTPVKHYSSGMHLRLAFAVAAYLESEILLVDEVLAVGDLSFQQKCLGKMSDVASQGRTVLFVSHNLGAVREFCETSLVLERGRVICRGSIVEGLAAYSRCLAMDGRDSEMRAGWRDVAVNDLPLGATARIQPGDPFSAQATLELAADVSAGRLFCIVEDGAGHTLIHQRATLNELRPRDDASPLRVGVELPALWMAPGVYSVYFKFIGRTHEGGDVRHLSERAIIDVEGSIAAVGKALLAPAAAWSTRSPGRLRAPVQPTHAVTPLQPR